MWKIINKIPFIRFTTKIKISNWIYKKTAKCEICNKGLFRFADKNSAGSHGAIDIDVCGHKKTIYVCLLCYHLHK